MSFVWGEALRYYSQMGLVHRGRGGFCSTIFNRQEGDLSKKKKSSNWLK